MAAHIFDLKRNAFVLWRPHNSDPVPKLIIGEFKPGNPPILQIGRSTNSIHFLDIPMYSESMPQRAGSMMGRCITIGLRFRTAIRFISLRSGFSAPTRQPLPWTGDCSRHWLQALLTQRTINIQPR